MLPKIAILIDAENVSYKDLDQILEAVSRYGEVILRAVYGDWQRPGMKKWRQAAEKHNFQIRHQPHTPNTKNSTDIKLMLDAMEVLFYVPVNLFCLVTNDADYVPLCHKIHESRKSVIGVGYENAPEALRHACDDFVRIKRAAPQSSQQHFADPLALRDLLSRVFAQLPPDKTGWVALGDIGSKIASLQPGFRPGDYGHTKLSNLLRSMPEFISMRGTGGSISARLTSYIQPEPLPQPPVPAPATEDLTTLLAKAFLKAPCDPDGWVSISILASVLPQVLPGFRSSHYGHGKLSKLLKSMPDFVSVRGEGSSLSARLTRYVQPEPPPQPPVPAPAPEDPTTLLAQAFLRAPCDVDGWVDLSVLSSALSQVQQGFKPRLYGHSNLSKLLKSLPDLIELQAVGSVKYARLKSGDQGYEES